MPHHTTAHASPPNRPWSLQGQALAPPTEEATLHQLHLRLRAVPSTAFLSPQEWENLPDEEQRPAAAAAHRGWSARWRLLHTEARRHSVLSEAYELALDQAGERTRTQGQPPSIPEWRQMVVDALDQTTTDDDRHLVAGLRDDATWVEYDLATAEITCGMHASMASELNRQTTDAMRMADWWSRRAADPSQDGGS